MEGLAVAIGVAMIVMVTVPVVVLVLVAKRFGTVAMVVALLVGLVVGGLAVTATFFERTWNRPIAVVFEGATPHTLIFVVPDPKAAPIDVTGLPVPLMQRKAVLRVPTNGVVYVKDLAPIQGEDLESRLNGKSNVGALSTPGLMAFDFSDTPAYIDDVGAELAKRLSP